MALAPQYAPNTGLLPNLQSPRVSLNTNPQSNMSPTTPMGVKTASPVTNIKLPPNTTNQPVTTPPQGAQTTGSQNTPSTPSGNSNPISNPGLIGQLAGYGNISNDPTYMRLMGESQNIQSGLPVALTNIINDTTRGIPESVEQSRIGATNSQYSNLLAAKQAEIGNYLTGRGQSIGAATGAAGLTQPQNQLGFLTNPQTGQPLYGNGSIGGLAGLSYQAGKINNAGSLAGQQQNQGIAINNARNDTTQLNNLLKTSNLNQNQLALSNWLGNTVAKNLSDPTLGPIQNAITSAINHYALAQGISPADLTNSLLSQSGSQSILSVLSNLDTGAYNNYINTGNFATGGGVNAPATNLGTSAATNTGTLTDGTKYIINGPK